MRTKRTAFVAITLLVIAGSVSILIVQRGRSDGGAQRDASLGRASDDAKDPQKGLPIGISEREGQPQMMGTGWARFEYNRSEYLNLLETPKKLDEEVKSGNRAWNSTMLDLVDPLTLERKLTRCKENLTKDFNGGACQYNLDLVVEKQKDGKGEVVFSRAIPVGGVFPPGCEQFAACDARVHLGENLPLPAEAGERLALQLFKERQGIDAQITDREQIAKIAKMLEDDAEAAASMHRPDVPDWEYQVEMQKRVLAFMKYRLENM